MAAQIDYFTDVQQEERKVFAFGVMSPFIIVTFVTGIFFGHILEKYHALEIEAKQARKKTQPLQTETYARDFPTLLFFGIR